MPPLDDAQKILILDFLKEYEREREDRQDKRWTRWITASGVSGLLILSGVFFLLKQSSESAATTKAEEVASRFIPKTYIEEIQKQTFSGLLDARASYAADRQNFILVKEDYQKLIAEAQGLADSVRGVKAKLDAVSSASSGAGQSAQPTPVLPVGMIAPFNISTRELKCPEGWALFSEAVGRFIVGAGFSAANRDQNGRQLTGRPSFAEDPSASVGGEEQHTLTVAEMPQHSHQVYPHAGSIIGASGRFPGAGSADPNLTSRTDGRTDAAGGGQPHNIMPPFIALVYCRKI
jgi:hypothetical protein